MIHDITLWFPTPDNEPTKHQCFEVEASSEDQAFSKMLEFAKKHSIPYFGCMEITKVH